MDNIDGNLHYIDMDYSLRMHTGHHTFCPSDWTWDSRIASFVGINFWFIESGCGELRVTRRGGSETLYPLRSGDCFLLRACDHQVGCHDMKCPLVVPFIIFEVLVDTGEPVAPDKLPWDEYRTVPDVAFMAGLLKRSIDAYERRDQNQAVHWLGSAIRELESIDQAPRLSGRDADYARIIREFIGRVRRNPAGLYAIDQLSESLHCTRDHAIRLFRRLEGCTPMDFVIDTRIAAARDLLRGSSYDIGQIAERLGYADVHFFSRQFKQRTGISPRAYRKSFSAIEG